MHNFFRIIDRAGIKNSRMAANMQVTAYEYSLVKQGKRNASPAFRDAAMRTLEAIGIRNHDGSAYSESDLFELAEKSVA